MGITPNSRPKITEQRLREIIAPILAPKGLDEIPPLMLVGVRGYYLNFGNTPQQERGFYDDAIIVLGDKVYATFNANTDPSIYRPGIATLCTGLHWFKKGNHGISRPGGGYPALRPATPDETLPATRDGQTGIKLAVATNIHKGGVNTTSSEGCQTLPPDQWNTFKGLVYAEMTRLKMAKIAYLLIENKGQI